MQNGVPRMAPITSTTVETQRLNGGETCFEATHLLALVEGGRNIGQNPSVGWDFLGRRPIIGNFPYRRGGPEVLRRAVVG